VAHLQVPLYAACNQVDGKPLELWNLGEAVAKGVIANETLGYFLGRIFLFMVKIGVDSSR
jgi:glycyl-tRNA synthetase